MQEQQVNTACPACGEWGEERACGSFIWYVCPECSARWDTISEVSGMAALFEPLHHRRLADEWEVRT